MRNRGNEPVYVVSGVDVILFGNPWIKYNPDIPPPARNMGIVDVNSVDMADTYADIRGSAPSTMVSSDTPMIIYADVYLILRRFNRWDRERPVGEDIELLAWVLRGHKEEAYRIVTKARMLGYPMDSLIA